MENSFKIDGIEYRCYLGGKSTNDFVQYVLDGIIWNLIIVGFQVVKAAKHIFVDVLVDKMDMSGRRVNAQDKPGRFRFQATNHDTWDYFYDAVHLNKQGEVIDVQTLNGLLYERFGIYVYNPNTLNFIYPVLLKAEFISNTLTVLHRTEHVYTDLEYRIREKDGEPTAWQALNTFAAMPGKEYYIECRSASVQFLHDTTLKFST